MDRSERTSRLDSGAEPRRSALDPSELLELDRRLRALARTLVGDSALADDVVQEAWLTLLGRAAGRPRRLRGWMGGVVRHHAADAWQGRRRRAVRERRAARPEATKPDTEALESGETRDVLAGTIERIAEPYRSALRLRFFEGLEIDEIAARTGCANGTVRSRLSRGIEELRRRLDERYGDRSRWGMLLAPLVGKTGWERALAASALARYGGLAALVLALTALVVGALYALRAPAAEDERVAGLPAAAPRAVEERPADEPAAPERALAQAPPESTPPPASDLDAPSPGNASPVLARLELRVVDRDGAPVRAASAELRGPDGPRFVRSDTDRIGIEVRAADLSPIGAEEHVLVRAFAPGEAESLMAFVPLRLAGDPLVLATAGPASALTVTVRDPEGAPVDGATVRVSVPGRQGYETLDSGIRLQRAPRFARTDAEGAARFEHLARELRQIDVEAEGFVASVTQVELRAEAQQIDVVLARGGRLVGRARLEGGAPAAGARVELVRTLAAGRASGLPAATADDEGRFELTALPPEPHLVFARVEAPDGALLLDSTIVEAAGAQPSVWDPLLAPHHGLTLALVDERGAPVGGATVVLSAELGSGRYPGFVQLVSTDPAGVARFPALPDASHYLLFQRGPNDVPVIARGLRAAASAGEVRTIVVPPAPGGGARIEGRLLEADGSPARGARVRFDRRNELAHAEVDPTTGRFELVDALAGEYELLALVDGRGALSYGTREVAPGELVQLGQRRLPPPVPVRFVWPDGRAPSPSAPWTVCVAPRDGVGRVVPIATIEAAEEAFALLPGSYHLARGDWRTPSFEVLEGAAGLELVVDP